MRKLQYLDLATELPAVCGKPDRQMQETEAKNEIATRGVRTSRAQIAFWMDQISQAFS